MAEYKTRFKIEVTLDKEDVAQQLKAIGNFCEAMESRVRMFELENASIGTKLYQLTYSEDIAGTITATFTRESD